MTSSGPPDALALLDAWQERGADSLDPARFYFIKALAKRTATQSGAARRLLDDRLNTLLKSYADDVAKGIGNTAQATPVESGTGPLAELVAYTASQAPRDGTGGTLNDAAWRRAFPLESSAIDYFRATWSKVSTNRQLRQSQARVPGNAGPLNSSNLVHRSLSLMHELSPGYLHHFLSYVDALSWMEQMSNGVAAKEGLRAASTKKSPRGRR